MINIINLILLLIILAVLVKRELVLPRKNSGNQAKLIMDSSGLIDGRILDIAKASFVGQQIIIPEFILKELQTLADGHDSHKRERARFGLDVVKSLQDLDLDNVQISRIDFPGTRATDDKLVKLCKRIKGQLYTTDYNLSKVAEVEGIKVLNVNELAQNLRPVALPGESAQVKIVQKGSNPGQGVGYLDDGTMVVVDNAAKYIGRKVTITVDRMHQTVAGKMVFGKLVA